MDRFLGHTSCTRTSLAHPRPQNFNDDKSHEITPVANQNGWAYFREQT